METRISEEHALRQRKALELRKGGANYDAIAVECGYVNRGGAYKAVAAALAAITAEPAEEVRKLELERLDVQYERLIASQVGLDAEPLAKVAAVAIKVQERRARLLGLDAPVKVQEVAPDKLTDEQLRAELERALAALPKAAS